MSPEDIRELFAALGPVAVRRLFGGAGLYAEGVMFALVHRSVIYLKADGQNAAAFEREGLAPFTYATRDGTRELASYRRMPDRLYDDPDELAGWAREALAAARNPLRGRGRGRRPRPRPRPKPRRNARPAGTEAAVRLPWGRHRPPDPPR